MDTSHLDPSKFYLVSGKTMAEIKSRQDALWGGDNIQRGPGIFRRGSGTGGFSLAARGGGGNAPSFAAATSFPWNLYNKTVGATGQVQVNGGDTQVAQLNSKVCNVNGHPSDTLISGAYPKLAVTGNGYIYAYAVPTTAGTASPLASLDLYYQGSMQSQDTANPARFYWMLVATISNYAVDGSGNISFDVNNVYGSGYGPSTLIYCSGAINVY
jgi:hypothetical protein